MDDCVWIEATGLCRDVFSDNVRTASVHLNYDAPISKPAWWFQRVIPTATEDVTYFSSNGHRFGYGGIQMVDETTGRVLFSLWDQGGCDRDIANCNSDQVAQTVACGEGVTCTDFGGEGTGRKSYFDSDQLPVVGEAYYMVTQAAYLGNGRMEYTGYFYDGSKWKLLSRIQVSTNDNEEWWIGGMYSFVEQWLEVDTTKNRAALYGPSFMAAEDGQDFVQVEWATFSHGTLENHEHVNAWQAGADQQYAVGIETGGSAIPEAQLGDKFSYVPVQPDTDELLGFKNLIPCLGEASDKDTIESCLAGGTTTSEPTKAPTLVSCGGHFAATCGDCPEGNGAAWCNGDCSWVADQCTLKQEETNTPTRQSTLFPTKLPTQSPTGQPTKQPTEYPTKQPTEYPTKQPTMYPTKQPTEYPTKQPTMYPTKQPTEYPTKQPTELPYIDNNDPVSCGGHYASTCGDCPEGNGAAWCNGDCSWVNEECVETPPPAVSCGGHYASTCGGCPEGNGAAWCNGDCSWVNEECVETPPPVSCGGHYAPTCGDCPEGNGAAWCNGDCTWADDECQALSDNIFLGI
jgi:hypothetical protein